MKRKKVDSSLERAFITALITSKPFLSAASALLEPELLSTKYTQQIARWCLKYYREYKDAPGRAIEPIYHAWVERENRDDADVVAIGDFLGALSAEYDSAPLVNVPYLLDELSTYLTLKKIAQLTDTLQSSLLYGNKAEAMETIQNFRGINTNERTGYNPTQNRKAYERAFAQPNETIINFPGAAGEFFGPALTRDALIGIQGIEKRGKTWWLLEMLYRALRSHCRVAFFEVGDLSEHQLTKRLAMRVAGLPLWENQKVVQYPTKIEIVDKKAETAYLEKKITHPLDAVSAWRAQKKFNRIYRITNKPTQVMFSVHANGTINVRRIGIILDGWKQELGFVPDVILIDYADILEPEEVLRDERGQINQTWAALRRLSQERHALVVVPTQADAAAYDVKLQKMKNFSNDKRKNAHVTGMVGLNQTAGERRQGIMRLNWLLGREFGFDESRCLWVAQCIPLGAALVKSAW